MSESFRQSCVSAHAYGVIREVLQTEFRKLRRKRAAAGCESRKIMAHLSENPSECSVRLGGSGIKKRGVATTHRCILRCLTQLGFEALSVATTQSIAWKTGPSFSLRGLPCE